MSCLTGCICHELFSVFGDFYALGMHAQDSEVTKSLRISKKPVTFNYSGHSCTKMKWKHGF